MGTGNQVHPVDDDVSTLPTAAAASTERKSGKEPASPGVQTDVRFFTPPGKQDEKRAERLTKGGRGHHRHHSGHNNSSSDSDGGAADEEETREKGFFAKVAAVVLDMFATLPYEVRAVYSAPVSGGRRHDGEVLTSIHSGCGCMDGHPPNLSKSWPPLLYEVYPPTQLSCV